MFACLRIENNSAGISKFCFLEKQNGFGAVLEKVWRKISLKYFVCIFAEVLEEGKYFLFCLITFFLFLNVGVNNEQWFELH